MVIVRNAWNVKLALIVTLSSLFPVLEMYLQDLSPVDCPEHARFSMFKDDVLPFVISKSYTISRQHRGAGNSGYRVTEANTKVCMEWYPTF